MKLSGLWVILWPLNAGKKNSSLVTQHRLVILGSGSAIGSHHSTVAQGFLQAPTVAGYGLVDMYYLHNIIEKGKLPRVPQ